MTTPVRPVFFLERRLPLLWVFIVAAVVLALLVVAGRVTLKEAKEPAPVAATPHDDGQRVSEHRSADGRAVCYTAIRGGHAALSCLPAWLLDRPNSWLVAYPPSAVAKRPAAKQSKGNSKESAK